MSSEDIDISDTSKSANFSWRQNISLGCTTVVRSITPSVPAPEPPARYGLSQARLEPADRMPLSPFFLEIRFPTNIPGRQISSFAFDNSGSRLHLVPDVVVASGSTNRVRILVHQLRSYGCGAVSLDELRAKLIGLLNAPATKAKLAEGYFEVITNASPEEYRQQIAKEIDLVGRIVKASGIQPIE